RSSPGYEHGPHWFARARHDHQESRLRGQDLSTLFRGPGEAAMLMHICRAWLTLKPTGESSSLCGFVILALILFLQVPSFVRADFDPGLNQPYHLQIILHIAENRFLTPIFQEQLELELRDHLQLTYGKLAKVEVVRNHPLLREVRAKGLQALD